ncbi:CHAT domain-containing protein [Dactylosporangium sp. NPDC005555]|uniref:CHAT domain-containing protein n=1 Tax=Dactylosporangium sp. NPDC005555 TaxID=3154889 RepID=UPI0033B3AC68
MGEHIRILMLAANPAATSRLALDEEAREINEKLQLSQDRDTFDLITRWAVRPADLLQDLNQFRPQIVHFSGHGTANGEIVLSTGTGGEHRVGTEALAGLFRTMKDDVRIVVLNACYSAAQAQAISRHIDYIVGMTAPIDDRSAVVFAAAFYSALGFRRTVEEACDQATTALMLHGLPDHAVPELIVRPGAKTAAWTGEVQPAKVEDLFSPLPAPVTIAWRSDFDRSLHRGTYTDPAIELHVVPLGAPPLSARIHAGLVDSLPARIRAVAAVPATEALQLTRDTAGATVTFDPPQQRWNEARSPQLQGLRLAADGQVSIWSTLPRDSLSAVLDRDHLPTQIADLLRLIGRLELLDAEHMAVAAGVQSTLMLSINSVDRLPRQQAGMLSLSDKPIRVEPDERVSAAALAGSAPEAARALSRAILDAATVR